MILAAFALLISGIMLGAVFTGAVFYLWIRQNPQRLGYVARLILDGLADYNGGRFIKLYASLFDTRRCSKVMVYAKPEDVAEAIGWYARPNDAEPVSLQTRPAWPTTDRDLDADSKSKKDPSSAA